MSQVEPENISYNSQIGWIRRNDNQFAARIQNIKTTAKEFFGIGTSQMFDHVTCHNTVIRRVTRSKRKEVFPPYVKISLLTDVYHIGVTVHADCLYS